VVLEGDHAKLLSTTDLQTFGLIVTAEPYFAVTQPSDVVVAENFLRDDTSGTIEQVDAKFELLERGQYVMDRGHYVPGGGNFVRLQWIIRVSPNRSVPVVSEVSLTDFAILGLRPEDVVPHNK
jgi:hypothetical protein